MVYNQPFTFTACDKRSAIQSTIEDTFEGFMTLQTPLSMHLPANPL